MWRGVLAATVVLAGCSGVAPTAPGEARRGSDAATLAADRLGEAIATADRRRFAELDADGDGRLGAAEAPTGSLAALDADRDGALTLEEALAQAPDGTARRRMALAMARAERLATVGHEAEEQAALRAPLAAREVASAAMRFAERPAPPPDGLGPGGPPVVMVPGYLDGSWYFGLLRKRVHALGRASHQLDLFPNISDITVSAQRLRAFVDKVRAETGAATVDLVAHSEGGLIARYYIKYLGGEHVVGRLVTLATPHHGTILGWIGPGMGAKQMRPGSAFLNELNAGDESWGPIAYTSVRGGLDEIIIPHDSMIQEGAENRLVPWVEHATIFTSRAAWRHVQEGLAR